MLIRQFSFPDKYEVNQVVLIRKPPENNSDNLMVIK